MESKKRTKNFKMYCTYIMDSTNDKIYLYKYCNKTIKVKTLGAHLKSKKHLENFCKGDVTENKVCKMEEDLCIV